MRQREYGKAGQKLQRLKYDSKNIVHSQFGDPPSDYSPGLLFCPFFQAKCLTDRCAGWHHERRFCWLIWKDLALCGGLDNEE